MNFSDNRRAMMGLFAGLVSRGLSARVGQRIRCSLQDVGDAKIEYDLCFYLDLTQSGERWALLTRRADMVSLVGVQKATSESAGQEVERLFRSVLERSCALMGVLAKAPLLFQGCAAQRTDVDLFRRALETAFQRLGMVPVVLNLVAGAWSRQMALLVPGEVMTSASKGLDDPENEAIRKAVVAHEEGAEDAEMQALNALLDEQVATARAAAGLPAVESVEPERVTGDLVHDGEAYCVFNSLVDLSDRDLRSVLECPEVRELGAHGLGCALSQASQGFREKVFRNLSSNRRKDVQEFLAEDWDEERVAESQTAIKEMAFMLNTREQITPPPSIKQQFDRFYIQWNAWQNDRAKGVRKRFEALLEQLDDRELALAVRHAKREDLLWALQECEEEVVNRFLEGISTSQRELIQEDLPFVQKRVRKRVEVRYHVIRARVAVIEVSQKIIARRGNR